MTGSVGVALLALRQIAIVVLVTTVAAMTLLVTMQRRLIYPLGYGSDPVPTAPTGFGTVRVQTPSGSLLVWMRPGRSDRPVLLFLHGNATGVDGIAHVTAPFAEEGWSIVAPEYPGYPGNAGSPSEEGLLHAARAGWEAATRSGRPSRDVVLLGNSIGSGPAIALAAETRPRGLAIVSGIASLPQVVRTRFPFVPDVLVWDRYANAAAMAHVRTRVLVLHGDRDDLVPPSQGRMLAAAAGTVPLMVAGGHDIIVRRAIQDAILKRFSRS